MLNQQVVLAEFVVDWEQLQEVMVRLEVLQAVDKVCKVYPLLVGRVLEVLVVVHQLQQQVV
jgi:hypothetical protein